MTRINKEKTISANSCGIIISYGNTNKHQFIKYENTYVKKIQLEGTVKYQKIEERNDDVKLSLKQKDLYFKAVYGFKAYTQEELSTMPENTKMTIKTAYNKVQRLLTKWKQELTFDFADRFLLSIFPKSPITKQLVNVKGYLYESTDTEISFKDLGIKRRDIINKLIEFNILPQNFYQLT